MDWVDAVSIAGSILSLLGVAIAAAQIRKTRLAAEAAAEAARKTQSAIRRSVLLADVATFLRTLEEIKVYVRTEGYESALLRVTDLHLSLTQLRYLEDMPESALQDGMDKMLAQLSLMQETLEQKVNSPSTKVNPNRINSQLSQISARLSEWLGQEKYSIRQGEPR